MITRHWLSFALGASLLCGACGSDSNDDAAADVAADASVNDSQVEDTDIGQADVSDADGESTDASAADTSDNEVTEDVVELPDADAADIEDAEDSSGLDAGVDASVRLNSCGGLTDLLLDGVATEPGDACTCGGIVVCDGPDVLRCVGAAPNVCGGCAQLDHSVGTACGACGDGTWACDGPDALSCEGASEPNDCGGCEPLSPVPDTVCDSEDGIGLAKCIGEDDVVCLGVGRNDCGGAGLLAAYPGAPCGTCRRGTILCDGRDDVFCFGSDEGENACGGCFPLEGEPGAPCGECGGVWECDPGSPDRVRCTNPDRNACGGCEVLEEIRGAQCSLESGEDGVFHCEGFNHLRCGPDERNACGGIGELDVEPLSACGECSDGVVICATPEAVTCYGAGAPNACGGCGLLPGVPGEPCAFDHEWECTDDGALTCTQIRRRGAAGTADAETELDEATFETDADFADEPTPVVVEREPTDADELGYEVETDTYSFEADGEEFGSRVTVRFRVEDPNAVMGYWSTDDGSGYERILDARVEGDEIVGEILHAGRGFAGVPEGGFEVCDNGVDDDEDGDVDCLDDECCADTQCCGYPTCSGLRTCPVPPEGYSYVPPGTSPMGSPPDELGRSDLAGAEERITVTLTRGYFILQTEVTQGDYEALMGSNPSANDSCGDNCPVDSVTYPDAVAFVNALSVRDGLDPCYDSDGLVLGDGDVYACDGYRLPTEAEWERAARSGTTTATYNGDLATGDCVDATLVPIAWHCGVGGGSPQPVAELEPSPWGIYDMLGNLTEWVWDDYDAFSEGEVRVDPAEPPQPGSGVVRGGGYTSPSNQHRAAFRNSRSRSTPSAFTGFRTVITYFPDGI